MRSLVADERFETSDDTARLPSLPASFVPESLPEEASAAPESPAPRPSKVGIAVLGPTLRFKGDISADEDFILLGRVEGSIRLAQRIVIASSGIVVGTIHARVVVVDGSVQGDLHGTESVIVQKSARVVGNIFAPKVVLTDGAQFNGRIDMSGDAVVNRDSTPNAARVEAPVPNRPLQLAAEPTEKVATQKVTVVPPPAKAVGRAAVG